MFISVGSLSSHFTSGNNFQFKIDKVSNLDDGIHPSYPLIGGFDVYRYKEPSKSLAINAFIVVLVFIG